jgi:7-keto-8-aminopelargonate synthetase-like enzyme
MVLGCDQEIDQLCDEWTPEPLHPPITKEMELSPPVLESAAGPHTVVNGKDVINLSSANYLGLIGHPKIKEACNAALEKYGVGACGPRGFYGTIGKEYLLLYVYKSTYWAQFYGESFSRNFPFSTQL